MRAEPPFPVQLGWFLRDLPRAARLRLAALGGDDPTPLAEPSALADGSARTVVIVPGVYETWHAMAVIARALHARGHVVHVLPELGGNARPIDETARRLVAALEARDLRDVVLVAHSKGGLVGKLAMLREGTPRRIAALVAVATPFSGTRRSDWMLLPALRAFRPADPIVRELVGATAVDARITSIAPRVDPHIPEGSALGAGRDVELPLAGHFRVLEDPRAIDAVIAAVRAAPHADAVETESRADAARAGTARPSNGRIDR